MKMRCGFATTAALAAALAFMAADAAAEPGRGKVVLVSGEIVGLEFPSGDYALGSKVELSFSTGDGDVIPYGHWCVDDIRQGLLAAGRENRKWAITARPVSAQGQATIGLSAVTVPLQGPELVQWFEQASAAGCSGAKVRLAAQYKHGRDVVQDWQRALELLREAARDDHFEARSNLADLLADQSFSGSGDEASKQAARSEAFQIRLGLAKDGHVLVYQTVGHSYLVGNGTKVDLAQAEEWYRLAENNKMFKDSEPLVDLAFFLERLYGQSEKAVALLKEGARSGGKKAQAELQRQGLSW